MSTIAIDWGAARVGVAVSGSDVLATPHSVLPNDDRLLPRLTSLIEEYEADKIVVGMPKRETETAETRRIRELACELEERTGREVILWDESYSTIVADELNRSRGGGSRRREPTDHQAAAVILQSWLDAGGSKHSQD